MADRTPEVEAAILLYSNKLLECLNVKIDPAGPTPLPQLAVDAAYSEAEDVFWDAWEDVVIE